MNAAVLNHLGWCRVGHELGEDQGDEWLNAHLNAKAGLSSLQRELVESAIARGDWACAKQMVLDFRGDRRPCIQIEKFSPGEHYYVGRVKFSSHTEAVTYAIRQGYRVDIGVKITSMSDMILAARASRKDHD